MGEDNHKNHLLEAYKALYFYELDRKEKIAGRFPLLLAIYSLLIGVAVSYLNNMPEDISGVSGILFVTMFVLFCVAVLWSAYYAVRFLILDRRDNTYIRSPEAINEYMELIEEYNLLVDQAMAIDTDEEICDFFIEQYAGTVTENFLVNKNRYALLGKAVTRIILAAALALATAAPYFSIKLHAPRTVHKAAIIQTSEEALMKRDKEQNDPKPRERKQKLEFDPVTGQPLRPKRPGLLRLRDSETVEESKRRRDDGVW